MRLLLEDPGTAKPSVLGFFGRFRRFLRERPLHGPDYHHFREIIIPGLRGTTEIDHLVVSKFGIFVVELKDYSGWIFGNADDASWTATYRSGNRFKFQNPLRQNYGHLKSVETFLSVEPHLLHGVVVFRGSFEFMTPIPDGVLCHEYKPWIAAWQDVVLDDAAVDSIVSWLQMNARHGGFAALKHVESVRLRHVSGTKCPKCGGDLRLRTQKKGPEPGSEFLGCANYPSCRCTRQA